MPSVTLPPFDPFSMMHPDPYAAYREYRAQDPVHFGLPAFPELAGSWYLFRHADCLAALSNPRIGRVPPAERRAIEQQPELWQSRSIMFSDPPHSTRLRSFVIRAFSPRAVESLLPRIAALTDWPVSHAEPLQVLRYEPGQEYKAHFDAFPETEAGAPHLAQGGQRVQTVLIYLAAPDKGGETWFPKLGLRVRPKAGSAVIFRNVEGSGQRAALSLHSGEPVAAGEPVLLPPPPSARTPPPPLASPSETPVPPKSSMTPVPTLTPSAVLPPPPPITAPPPGVRPGGGPGPGPGQGQGQAPAQAQAQGPAGEAAGSPRVMAFADAAYDAVAIPEPGTLALSLAGLALTGRRLRRRG